MGTTSAAVRVVLTAAIALLMLATTMSTYSTGNPAPLLAWTVLFIGVYALAALAVAGTWTVVLVTASLPTVGSALVHSAEHAPLSLTLMHLVVGFVAFTIVFRLAAAAGQRARTRRNSDTSP